MKITHEWLEEIEPISKGLKKAKVIIKDNDGEQIIGWAFLHPDDEDLGNERTGIQIAHMRATITLLSKRVTSHRNILMGLNHYKSILDQSKKTNKDSYEYKTLLYQIKNEEIEIETFVEERERIREELRAYIQNKEAFYRDIRANREKAKAKLD